jgi:S-adenosylmethionine:tRNA ribosyltransferase-isomerase
MKTDQFEYSLPEGFIAQYPSRERGESRLLVLNRATGLVEHTRFDRIVDHIHPNDVLILNETRVIPARLLGARDDTGGKVEILLLREIEENLWEALAKPGKKAREGTRIVFGGEEGCEVQSVLDSGKRILRFDCDAKRLISGVGTIPLPPYIDREPEEIDRHRYQTVFARRDGSAAAPTAGLHFTEEILEATGEIAQVVFITLHVGVGTFRPIRVEELCEHEMDVEHYDITPEVAEKINGARGKRIAVGTSVVRALEASGDSGRVKSGPGEADIFIYPSYEFKVVDQLVTNFHLPRSTTFVLTAAFAGLDRLKGVYAEAIGKGYRFYSYGDAMLIV